MTYIQTRSGLGFDFRSATRHDVRLSDIAHALARLNRFTGHTLHPYSVAQHSVWCAREAADRAFDIQTQRWCLMHDAAEAYVGDVASPLKALLPQYSAIEDRVLRLVRDRFHLGECPDAVHAIDREALAWEFAHVFDRPKAHWSPVRAEEMFLREARRLDLH